MQLTHAHKQKKQKHAHKQKKQKSPVYFNIFDPRDEFVSFYTKKQYLKYFQDFIDSIEEYMSNTSCGFIQNLDKFHFASYNIAFHICKMSDYNQPTVITDEFYIMLKKIICEEHELVPEEYDSILDKIQEAFKKICKKDFLTSME